MVGLFMFMWCLASCNIVELFSCFLFVCECCSYYSNLAHFESLIMLLGPLKKLKWIHVVQLWRMFQQKLPCRHHSITWMSRTQTFVPWIPKPLWRQPWRWGQQRLFSRTEVSFFWLVVVLLFINFVDLNYVFVVVAKDKIKAAEVWTILL